MKTERSHIIPHLKRFAALGLIVGGISACAFAVLAGDMIPYKGKAVGKLVDIKPNGDATLIEVGEGTHLGKFTARGTVNLVTGAGHIVITAANKDNLFADTQVQPSGDVRIAYIGGTGRFDGATGGCIATLILDNATMTYTATAAGVISTVGNNKK